MKPCMYVGESFVILPVTVESAAMSAQQSAATRFQTDQNTVVVPSTQLGFYSSQERIKTLPRVKQYWKEREQAVRVCVVCCSVTMDSSWILTKSIIIGDLTISAGAWVKKNGGINSLFIKQFIWAEAIFSIKVRKILSFAFSTAWPWNSSPVKIISLKKKKEKKSVFMPQTLHCTEWCTTFKHKQRLQLEHLRCCNNWSAAWKCGS